MKRSNTTKNIICFFTTVVILLILVFLLSGCGEKQDSTLTCNYTPWYDDVSVETVITYNDDEIISYFIDGVESENKEFWNEDLVEVYGSVDSFIFKMEGWYTSELFDDSTCEYN